MDTIRETIIKDILARLAVITVANGYNTGIGGKVLRARKTVDPEDLPLCDVWPQPEKAENAYGQSICTMAMKIEGLTKFLTENPSVVSERILGDLKKCILSQYDATTIPPTGWNRPAYIESIIYTGGGTDEYPDEGSVSVGAYITVDVTYMTKLDDPYTQ